MQQQASGVAVKEVGLFLLLWPLVGKMKHSVFVIIWKKNYSLLGIYFKVMNNQNILIRKKEVLKYIFWNKQ